VSNLLVQSEVVEEHAKRRCARALVRLERSIAPKVQIYAI